jgi:hypothetical protein
LVGDPVASNLFGDAQGALVELVDDACHGFADGCRGLAGLQRAAVFPRLIDDLLDCLHDCLS